MRVEFVEPFVSSAFHVFESVMGETPAKGQLSLRQHVFASQQVTIVAGVNGEIEGTVLYGMSLVTAQKIAAAMIGSEVDSLDDMALSAVSELGNMITGSAATKLSQSGFDVDITPPSVIRGSEVEITTRTPALVVPVNTQFGKVEINVAIAENTMKKAA